MPTHLSVPGESSSSQALVEADKHDSIPEIRLPDEEGAGAGERRVSNVRSNLIKIRKSFRDQAHTVRQTIQQEAHRIRRVPRWVRVANTLYHDWGLKHACLIGILIIYNFIGAAIFFYAEASNDVIQEDIWIDDIAKNRTKFVDKIIPSMFNNSDFLFFLTGDQTKQVEAHLNKELSRYEMQLGVKYKPDQKIKWDFWNAMLYAQTLCTTIGDAQLYCVTKLGRILSMIYATIGIPLVLSVLDDMGKVLTKCLKTPWWLVKCGCRRLFRYCTKQTMDEIRRLDAEDKLDLEVFDLPIPVAVVIVVVYICICAQTFRYVEKDWDYFTAFYYFFICLSTIGLGDISPSKPKFVLVLFIQIMVGLSLCSMCINVIQAKMKRTYEAGKMQFDNLSSIGGSEHRLHWDSGTNGPPMKPRRRGSSLGVFRTCGSSYSLNREAIQERLARKDKHNKSTQTVLSFPSPTRNNLVSRSVNNGRMKRLPRTLSIDDVMKLVDTEEGDILLLTELAREESMASGLSTTTNTEDVSDTSQIVISKSFETNFNPALLVNHKSNTLPTIITPESKLSTTSAPVGTVAMAESPPPAEIGIAVPSGRLIRPSTISLQELEAQEEMEDRLALGNVLENAGVHFRSRLSLIPEHHSIIDEDGEPSVESKPPSPTDLRSPPLSSTNQNDGRGSRASSASGHSASIGSRIASILGRRRSSASVSSR